MNGTAGMIALLLLLLGATAGVAWWAWMEMGTVDIGLHGMIALLAGSAAAFLLGVGLMFLVYYSHKKGFDDEAGKD